MANTRNRNTAARRIRPANAKLSMAKANQIRKLSTNHGVMELARKYNVHHSTIQSVLANETWRSQ